MKDVIRLDKVEDKRKTVFTEVFDPYSGEWQFTMWGPSAYTEVVYLGNNLFVAYDGPSACNLYRGELNDGVY